MKQPISRHLVALTALAAAALLPAPAPAQAQDACGAVVTEEASGPDAPLAIGDSPMLAAVPELAAAGFDVNAHGCRQFPEGLSILRALSADQALPDYVVIALGTNGSITTAELEEAASLLGDGRALGLVTQLEIDPKDTADADTVRAFAAGRPETVVLVDWVALSEGQESWFQPDGIHLTDRGVRAFTDALVQGRSGAETLLAQADAAEEADAISEAGTEPEDEDGGFPWGTLLIVALVIAAGLAILRRRAVVAERMRARR